MDYFGGGRALVVLRSGRQEREPHHSTSRPGSSLGVDAGEKGVVFRRLPAGGSKERRAGKGPHLQDVSSQVLLKDFGNQRHRAPVTWGCGQREG